jgi:hypothetical protein
LWRPARRWVLDLLLGRPVLNGLGRDNREDDRDSIDGVVGADRPSIYETCWVESATAS